MSTILMFVGVLLIFGKASSHYNKSYNGYTLILPHDDVMDQSNIKPMQLSFSEAQRWCAKNVVGSTLATIPNRYVQQNITEFIDSALENKKLPINGNDNIRLNGRFNITNEWRWVNGRPKTAEFKVGEHYGDSGYSFYARLVGTSFYIYADNGRSSCYTICEYPGNSERCDLFLNGRCYQKRNWLYWHDARNECLDGGGDLASFETLSDTNINVSLKNLSLYLTTYRYYCIGLQKNEWRWEDTDSAIKYTNWSASRAFNYNLRCLCLTQYRWEWTECDCSKRYPFICMLKDMPDSSTQVTEETSTSTETIQFVILGVSCAVIFVVIIIIVAALIVKKRRNSDTPRALMSSGYIRPKHAVTESSQDFPVYEEIIQKPKETNIPASDTTYASVVRKTVAKTEEEEHPVNSIVYAELDLTPKE